MIVCKLEEVERYECLHPRFGQLFNYLRTHNLLDVAPGRIDLDGDNLYINNGESEMKTAAEQMIEVHKQYIDVHLPLDKSETIGWISIADMNQVEVAYNEEGDYAFYGDEPHTYVTLHPGECMIVFPEDGHAPIIGEGKMRKAVAKVLV
ncbi:MAG: YhcH/YjgK/YiaL family protein [Marinifilaceae bacterium]